ncbi:MAG: hypothetical protein WBW41_12165 [Verrucomicrobiia bacterium]
MKAQILLAHLAPHFHAGAAGFVLILFFLVAAIALILTAVFMDKEK